LRLCAFASEKKKIEKKKREKIRKDKKFNRSFINMHVFGFSLGDDPLKKFTNMIAKYDVSQLNAIEELSEGEILKTAVVVRDIKKHVDKRGKEMAFLTVDDETFGCSLTIFSSDWEKLVNEIRSGMCYIVFAQKNRGNNLLYVSSNKACKIMKLGI
jgi:DNA polymerase III alpha subunit